MLIGCFSDSHDHMTNIKKVIDIFIEGAVEKIIHCGDLVAPFIKRAMTKLDGSDIGVFAVFGNNDGERKNMNKILGETMDVRGDFMELTLNGIEIAVYHGTDPRLLDNINKSQKYDLVLTGHTHQVKIEKINETLVVNPGETCGYLTGKATCAIINLENKPLSESDVKIIEIE